MESINDRIRNVGRASLVTASNADREAEKLLDHADNPGLQLETGSPDRMRDQVRLWRTEAARYQRLAVEHRRIAEYAERGILFASLRQVATGELFRTDSANQIFQDALAAGLIVFEDRQEAKLDALASGNPAGYPMSS